MKHKGALMSAIGTGLLVVLLVAGYIAIAAETTGKEDPLVSVSYINDLLTKGTSEKIDSVIEDKLATVDGLIEEKIAAAEGRLDDRISAFTAGSTDGVTPSDAFTEEVARRVGTAQGVLFVPVDLPAGKRLTAAVGSELVLLSGSGNCYAADRPGLINLTEGTLLENGSPLTANHLYLAAAEGRGVTAVNSCKLLVKGSYTLS